MYVLMIKSIHTEESMETDIIKAKLYDYFCKEAGIVVYNSDRDSEYSREIIEILKVGRIVFTEYQDMNFELKEEPSLETVYYNCDAVNEDECVVNRLLISTGAVVKLIVYPISGYAWNEEERGLVKGFLQILSTVKSRIRMKEYMDYAVFHEMEHGYYNAFYFNKMIGMVHKLEKMADYSVIFINLVNISGLNTLLGRDKADKVMLQFTGLVSDMLEQPECLCRMGGDNFCILIRDSKVQDALEILQGTHFDVGGGAVDRVKLGAYCGVYNCTGKETDISECLDYAQSSMNMAKTDKNSPVQYYDQSMIDLMKKTRLIESCFKQAIRNHEFEAYYQPKINLDNYKLIGAEALCRWNRSGEKIMPDEFIPVLEKSRRICTLDYYILECVCQDIAGWMKEGKSPVRVSSNFSRKHLSNPDFVSDIIEIVDKYNIPHSLIVIEITETTTEADLKRLSEVVNGFRKAGFEVSVDDFGVGYSSMSMIKDIPFSEIKIDKSFLNKADISDRDMVMMKHIISMAEELGMSTIAEGVEIPEHIKLLRKYGCFHGQGYFFNKPLQKKEFEEVLDHPDYRKKGLEEPS